MKRHRNQKLIFRKDKFLRERLHLPRLEFSEAEGGFPLSYLCQHVPLGKKMASGGNFFASTTQQLARSVARLPSNEVRNYADAFKIVSGNSQDLICLDQIDR